MKVLQILYSGLGGHGSVVFSMLDADKKRLWDHVLVFFGIEDLKEEYASQCDVKNVRHYFVKKKFKVDVRSVKAICKIIDKEKPDRILLHSTILAPYFLFIHSSIRAKVVMVEHTPNHTKTKAEYLSSILGMLLFPKVVYLTEDYRTEMQQKLKAVYKAEKVAIIPNGINTDFFCPVTKKGDQELIVISMVARFSNTKDQSSLLRAFAKLLFRFPEKRHLLILAGDGDTRIACQQEAETLGIAAHCKFTGTLDEAGIQDVLQKTTVYVHSTKSETMSTSIMQAMSCGLPVIATNVPGIRNMLRHNETGILVPVGDAAEMANQIEFLLQNGEKRSVLQAAARLYAIDHFSNERMFAQYLTLLSFNTVESVPQAHNSYSEGS
ncbi:glycosyltransferase family 4 protein [Flavisolibacter sp. BT320]|nr:glycosyltransferase family 4 protein [Flavisolibacter longurius]